MNFWHRARRLTDALLILASASFVLVYVVVALTRLNYPFELEWMEGGMVDHVRRILTGQPLYTRPSLDFVSFLYPPLYYVVAALFAKVLGIGFFPLRLLSFLSSLGVFALLFHLIRKETGKILPAVVAVGLLAATYPHSGGWFDLARLDSFYLLLLLGGVVALRLTSSAAGACAAGLLFAGAYFTKQSALVIFLPLAAYTVLADRRRSLWFLGVAGLVMGAGTLILNRATQGWFLYYCLHLPSRHPKTPGSVNTFWTVDMLPALTVACLMGCGFAVFRLVARQGQSRYLYPLLAAGMIGSSWSVRTMVGAEVNNLLPALAVLSILAPLGLHEIRRRADEKGTWPLLTAVLLAQALFLVQLGGLGYDPGKGLPTAADRAAGERLVGRIKTIPGEVFVPNHGYLARLAGKPGFAHTLAMDNVFLDDEGPVREALAREMWGSLEGRRFAAVLLESDGRYSDLVLTSYAAHERLFESPDVFWPVTGARLRPEYLCLPK